MEKSGEEETIQTFDDRRNVAILPDEEAFWTFATDHWVHAANTAIADHGVFAVALSGGNTPKALFQRLAKIKLEWERILFFWSDERPVPPTHPESNYGTAMHAGLDTLPIPPHHIFRMPADLADLEGAAQDYEKTLRKHLPRGQFDLVMLGMGDDGHIASLFPQTHALHTQGRLVTANYVPQKHTWRLTLTYEGIHQSRAVALYVVGSSKSATVAQVLTGPYCPDDLPAQKVGTPHPKALWMTDKAAAEDFLKQIEC